MSGRVVTLDDKYVAERGQIYLTGIQALVRLPLMQRRRDRAAGLNTAGFVSGYRGSPLGGLDQALWQAQPHLAAHDIRFQPAINEELAATAVIGTQQTTLFPDALHDGVFAIWYGKGPGVDRAGDALKHANALGSAPKGGVLVVAGDDHGAVSSSMAHQSEQVMMSWMMPVLNPANLQDILDFGLLGIAMSRFSGCYVGFKVTSEIVECAGTVTVDPALPRILPPEGFAMPPGGLHLRWPDSQLAQEERLQKHKLRAVAAFARANGIDRIVTDSPRPRLGVVATGKAWGDLRQAMADLGIDDDMAADLGLRLYKVGLSWPLEPDGALAFADGLEEILVVEEKRPVIEGQLKDLLYGLPDGQRPAILGKSDERGGPLLPSHGELTPDMIARALLSRLKPDREAARGLRARLDFVETREREIASPPVPSRPPYFCSGCPHNASTKVPGGSRAFAGTGCHLMALGMNRDTVSILHMGAEGGNWVGLAPFVATPHMFQNLGDGTYVHSGSMVIRQAVAAGTKMTFKLLYNAAVAMTGGQPVEGAPTVPQITRQLAAEGVRRIAVVSDDPDRFGIGAGFAAGVTLHDRADMDAVQRDLRDWPGVSVLVYDQMCAAEKRRQRRRGRYPAAARRVVINEAVCENCGDCVRQSNCVSVIPKQTWLGPKRAIDQSSCNADYTCLDGFCPSFVTLEGATPRRGAAVAGPDPSAGLTAPPPPSDRPYGLLVAGVGGTGVVTIGQLIGQAAHMDGRAVSVLDFTGLSQKNGGVLTHIRLAPDAGRLHAARLGAGQADLLLACDRVVAAGPSSIATLRRGVSAAVVNEDILPTAAAVLDPDATIDGERLLHIIRTAAGGDRTAVIDAAAIAERLLGDKIYANVFLLGFAFQRGYVPVSLESLLRAIELNGAAVADNQRSFAWGRLAAVDRDRVLAAAGLSTATAAEDSLARMVERRAAYLVDYQNAAYARRYRDLVAAATAAERDATPDGELFARAVAEGYFKLLAVKDEYEVARLHTAPAFLESLRERFEGSFRLRLHLAPPFLPGRGDGRPAKRAYGAWILPPLRLLAAMRRLRGTAFDVFAHTAERRDERRLRTDYETLIGGLLSVLDAQTLPAAVALARLPTEVRGYGPIKAASVVAMEKKKAEILKTMRESGLALAAE